MQAYAVPSGAAGGLSPAQRLESIQRARAALLGGADTQQPLGLDPVIERSWRRCLSMGMEPDRAVAFAPVNPSDLRHTLDAAQPLIRAAAPVVRSLARAMLHTRYFAMLTDAHGTVIRVDGPVDSSAPQARAIARLGVNLSEAAVGTTAVGMALGEQQPVWLHRGEHFFHDTAVFSCAGAPICGPQGECVGMLDLTGVNAVEQPALRHLASQAARSIENALVQATPHRLMLRLNWPGRVLGEDGDGLVALDDDGMVVAMNRPAMDMLSARPNAGRRERHCADLFAVPVGQLFDAAQQRHSLEVPMWSGLRLQLLAQDADPVRGPDQRSAPTAAVPLRDLNSALIRKAVEDAGGNVHQAALTLGISRATVYRKLAPRRRDS